ncbi:MAG: DUF3387 domain-containing protein [Fibrobacter sp.]|nr:DUF3387 domain-containing protein [Fibrobacter sp.]
MNEDQLEQISLEWFRETGWETLYSPDIEAIELVLKQAETLSNEWSK